MVGHPGVGEGVTVGVRAGVGVEVACWVGSVSVVAVWLGVDEDVAVEVGVWVLMLVGVKIWQPPAMQIASLGHVSATAVQIPLWQTGHSRSRGPLPQAHTPQSASAWQAGVAVGVRDG
jgi:hypothetical protein